MNQARVIFNSSLLHEQAVANAETHSLPGDGSQDMTHARGSRHARSALSFLGSCLVVALLTGCASGRGSGSKNAVQEIHLFGVPVALNFDQTPGPDGFAVRIYASNSRTPKGLPITDGKLEILLFDGILTEAEQKSAEPLRVWSYDATKLKSYVSKSSIGFGYRFAPQWGDAKPARDHITIVTRYVSPRGTTIYSAPSTVSMTSK